MNPVRLVDATIAAAGLRVSPDERDRLIAEVTRRARAGAQQAELEAFVRQGPPGGGQKAAQAVNRFFGRDVPQEMLPTVLAGLWKLELEGRTVEEMLAALQQANPEVKPVDTSQFAPRTGLEATPPPAPEAKPGEKKEPAQQQQTYSPLLMARTVLQSMLANPPSPDNPEYKGDVSAYQADYDWWQGKVEEATKAVKTAQELELGILALPDGTLIDVSDPRVQRDPALQAQVAQVFAAQDAKARNDFTKLLNDLDLAEYNSQTAATNVRNDALSKSFQDALDVVKTQVDIGKADQATAIAQISRILQGQQESRLRAQETEEQLKGAAGWATQGGKTQYSAGDLGAAVAGLAKLAGIDASAPLLNFTGTRTVDPLALMAAGDEALGVGGRTLPEIPAIPRVNLPAAPQYGAPGIGPSLRRPVDPRTGQAVPPGGAPAPPAFMTTAPSISPYQTITPEEAAMYQ